MLFPEDGLPAKSLPNALYSHVGQLPFTKDFVELKVADCSSKYRPAKRWNDNRMASFFL